MNLDITEIIDRPLSLLVSNHLICQGCHIVDRDHERMRVGYACPTCGKPCDGGELYFSINIHILVDLIQEAYHSTSTKNKSGRLYEGVGSHDISVIIYFCTLRETLLDKFITELLRVQNIPEGICERLLSDNKFHIQKQDKLFKSLTEVKWKDAVSKLNENSKLNYCETDDFVLNAVRARNNFIHEGSKWSIDRELATSCMKNIWSLINLYVGLHNTYVHPLYKKHL